MMLNCNSVVLKCGVLFATFVVFAVAGDKILKNPRVRGSLYSRAFVDNFTHFCLGVISWLIIVSLSHISLWKSMSEFLLCGALSSLIDIDHFLAAKSFKLQDAVSLQHRPFLHNTTLILALSVGCIITSHLLKQELLKVSSWIFLVAGITHHLRDGLRRGLWFSPFGSTRPINFYAYLIISLVFPLICHIFMKRTNSYQEMAVVNLSTV